MTLTGMSCAEQPQSYGSVLPGQAEREIGWKPVRVSLYSLVENFGFNPIDRSEI